MVDFHEFRRDFAHISKTVREKFSDSANVGQVRPNAALSMCRLRMLDDQNMCRKIPANILADEGTSRRRLEAETQVRSRRPGISYG